MLTHHEKAYALDNLRLSTEKLSHIELRGMRMSALPHELIRGIMQDLEEYDYEKDPNWLDRRVRDHSVYFNRTVRQLCSRYPSRIGEGAPDHPEDIVAVSSLAWAAFMHEALRRCLMAAWDLEVDETRTRCLTWYSRVIKIMRRIEEVRETPEMHRLWPESLIALVDADSIEIDEVVNPAYEALKRHPIMGPEIMSVVQTKADEKLVISAFNEGLENLDLKPRWLRQAEERDEELAAREALMRAQERPEARQAHGEAPESDTAREARVAVMPFAEIPLSTENEALTTLE